MRARLLPCGQSPVDRAFLCADGAGTSRSVVPRDGKSDAAASGSLLSRCSNRRSNHALRSRLRHACGIVFYAKQCRVGTDDCADAHNRAREEARREELLPMPQQGTQARTNDARGHTFTLHSSAQLPARTHPRRCSLALTRTHPHGHLNKQTHVCTHTHTPTQSHTRGRARTHTHTTTRAARTPLLTVMHSSTHSHARTHATTHIHTRARARAHARARRVPCQQYHGTTPFVVPVPMVCDPAGKAGSGVEDAAAAQQGEPTRSPPLFPDLGVRLSCGWVQRPRRRVQRTSSLTA